MMARSVKLRALRKVMQSSRNWAFRHGSFSVAMQRVTMTWCIMLEEQGDERQGDFLHSVWKTVCFYCSGSAAFYEAGI